MDKPPIHNAKHLKERRSQLRNELTPAEATLWNGLKNRKLCNRKFRRQHSILNFIVDFYCPEEQLVIELDGNPHYLPGGPERDHDRDKTLTELGFRVVRYENKMVLDHPEAVLENITTYFKSS